MFYNMRHLEMSERNFWDCGQFSDNINEKMFMARGYVSFQSSDNSSWDSDRKDVEEPLQDLEEKNLRSSRVLWDLDHHNEQVVGVRDSDSELEISNLGIIDVQSKRNGSVHDSDFEFEISEICNINGQSERRFSLINSDFEFEMTTCLENADGQTKRKFSVHDSDLKFEITNFLNVDGQNERKFSIHDSDFEFEISKLCNVDGQNKRKFSLINSDFEFEMSYLENDDGQTKRKFSVHDSDLKFEISNVFNIDGQNERKFSLTNSDFEFEMRSRYADSHGKRKSSFHDSDLEFEIAKLCNVDSQNKRRFSRIDSDLGFEMYLYNTDGLNKRRVSGIRLNFNLDKSRNEDLDFAKDMTEAQPFAMSRSLQPKLNTVTDCMVWEYPRNLLLDRRYCPDWVEWTDYKIKRFRFKNTKKVAELWGERKGKSGMTWENFTRGLRYYYDKGILHRVEGTQLHYEFGPNAYGLETDDPNFVKANTFVSQLWRND